MSQPSTVAVKRGTSSQSRPSEFPRWPQLIAYSSVIVIATLVVYAQVLKFEFVSFDDIDYVTKNAIVRHGLSWGALRWAFGFHASNWHPLTWISLMLDAQLGGLNPAVFHATSVVWHVAAAIVLFLALTRMTRLAGPSCLVALLFAVHPLHVESVAWVAERKDVLGGFFWFLTMLAYASYAERPDPRRYLAVVVAFGLGLWSKPMVLTLPLVLLLLDVWPLRRLQFPLVDREAWAGAGRLVVEKLPLLAMSAISAVLTVVAQRGGGSVESLVGLSLVQRIENALISYAAYIAQMLWPARLSFFYPHPHGTTSFVVVALAAVLLIAATILALRMGRAHAYVTVGWFWFLGTLVPVIGLLQVGLQARADRYTYIPLVGLFMAVVWGAREAALAMTRRGSGNALASPRALMVISGVLVAALTMTARVQASYWHDSARLYSHALELKPDNAVAHNNLAIALMDRGDVPGALPHAREAARLAPWHPEVPITLGNALARSGKSDEAIAVYREAISRRPNDLRLRSNLAVTLGNALAQAGKPEQAIAVYEEAIARSPDDALLRSNLGAFLGEQGRLEESAAQFHEAIRVAPDDPNAHLNMGVLLARMNKLDDAIAEFAAAQKLDPANADIAANLERARELRSQTH